MAHCPCCMDDDCEGVEVDLDSLDASDLAAHFQAMNDVDRSEFFTLLSRHMVKADREQLLYARLNA